MAYNYTRYGGGLYCGNSAPSVVNCFFVANKATGIYGGAVYCSNGSPDIMNCTFVGNFAWDYAGVLYAAGDSDPSLTNSTLSGNRGAAIREGSSLADPTVSYCLFDDNPGGDYRVYGGSTYTGATSINTNVPGASNNIDGDPKFVGGLSGTATANATFDSGTRRTTIYDGRGPFYPGALAGKILTLYASPTDTYFAAGLITTNTETSMQIVGDLAWNSESGDPYAIADYRIEADSAARDEATLSGLPTTDFEGDLRLDATVTHCQFEGNSYLYLDDAFVSYNLVADVNNNVSGASNNIDGEPIFEQGTTGIWTDEQTDYEAETVTFTDSNASFVPGSLVGRSFKPNAASLWYQQRIWENTTTTIVTYSSANAFAAPGDSYEILDFHPMAASPGIDQGASLDAPAMDLDGKVRPHDVAGVGADGTGTEYDIGPYEYGASAPPPPTVTVQSCLRASPSPTALTSLDFTVTFSASVTGVDVSDFSPTTTGGVSGTSVTDVSGSGTSRTVTVSAGAGNGTIQLDVNNDGTIKDLALHLLDDACTSGQIYTVNRASVYVDPSSVLEKAGSLSYPFNTLPEALAVVDSNGTVYLTGGTTTTAPSSPIAQNVTLGHYGSGVARVEAAPVP